MTCMSGATAPVSTDAILAAPARSSQVSPREDAGA